MRRVLTPLIVLLLSFMAVHEIIRAEDDDDDIALAKIDKLFSRSRRRAWNDVVKDTSRDSNRKRELEWKLNDLLELDKTGVTKWPVARQDVEEEEDTETPGISTSGDDPVTGFNPVDKDEKKEQEVSEEEEDKTELHETTKKPGKLKKTNLEPGLIHKITQKLIDRKNKFTISLPVAIVTVGSVIILTCCCSLYIRNRLVSCIDTLLGRKKRRKKKLLAVDAERGRSTTRSKKRRQKSVSLSKRRARSLSLDTVNIGTQKSATTAKDVEEPSSTTGCYQCCKKKKKRGKKY